MVLWVIMPYAAPAAKEVKFINGQESNGIAYCNPVLRVFDITQVLLLDSTIDTAGAANC